MVVADILESEARAVASEVEGIACRVDVSDAASVDAMVAAALAAYGRIDVLVNNAAIFTELVQPRKSFDDIPVDEWDRVMAVNVRGMWLCCSRGRPDVQ